MIRPLVLAAGAGRRFGPGGSKLEVEWRGKPLIEHVLITLERARADGLVGPGVLVHPAGADRIRRLADAHRFRTVVSDRADRGVSESLKAGIAALASDCEGVTAALVCLGDQPALSPITVRRLVEAAARSSAALIRPRYDGAPDEPGHPVVIGRDHWPLVAEATGDRGLDPVLAAHALEWTLIPAPGANPDVDAPQDLARLG